MLSDLSQAIVDAKKIFQDLKALQEAGVQSICALWSVSKRAFMLSQIYTVNKQAGFKVLHREQKGAEIQIKTERWRPAACFLM